MGFNCSYRVENPFPQISDNSQVVQVGARDVRKWQHTYLGAHLLTMSPLSCLPFCKKEALSTDHCLSLPSLNLVRYKMLLQKTMLKNNFQFHLSAPEGRRS